MNVARILYPVQVLGPGNRIGIWVCGCARGCKGCSNPELWTAHPEYEISPDDVFSLIQKVSASHPDALSETHRKALFQGTYRGMDIRTSYTDGIL